MTSVGEIVLYSTKAATMPAVVVETPAEPGGLAKLFVMGAETTWHLSAPEGEGPGTWKPRTIIIPIGVSDEGQPSG